MINPSPKRSVNWLVKACDEKNLAEKLDQSELSAIGQEVLRSYQIDQNNRHEWDRQMERALKLAKQILEKKNQPFENASNVKHPLITVATIQFAARAYPEICKSGKVVKCQITGDDPKPAPAPVAPQPAGPPTPGQVSMPPVPQIPGPLPPGPIPPQAGAGPVLGPQPGPAMGPPPPEINQLNPQIKTPDRGPKSLRANRIEAHLNWSLTYEMSDWEADMDSLLHVLPVAGQCYKKTYYSSALGHNVSELVLPDDCYVSKGRSRDIEKAQRITHRLWIYKNDILEKIRSGLWLDVELGVPISTDSDIDAPYEFLEQHRYWDLDGDDYKEPYIITVHKDSGKVVRIVPRFIPENIEFGTKGQIAKITPDHYFVHYGFIPNPDGSINSLGFGQLLEPINASVNTVLNQLLDSGKIYNAGGGFIGRGVRIRGGVFTFSPGKWHLVDAPGGALKENMIPNPVREPSSVMFQLLGFLVTAGKEISSVQDLFTGEHRQLAANMPVGTMMALVEQGLKVYVAIYKRIYRSLTKELHRIYALNARYLDEKVSFQVSGHPEQFVGLGDYQAGDTLVMPVADPELSSDMQRMLKSQALREVSGRPGLNEIEVTRRMINAIRPEDPSELLLTDEELSGRVQPRWKPPPPPQQILAQAKAVRMNQQAQEATARLQMDFLKLQLELEELREKIANVKADTMLKLATAEDKAGANYMTTYKAEMDLLGKEAELKAKTIMESIKQFGKTQQGGNGASGQGGGNRPGGVGDVESTSDNFGGISGVV